MLPLGFTRDLRAVMPYVIEHDESVPSAIVRIMHEQITRAREHLTDLTVAEEKRIHDARKRFKETRALIRLVREPLGPQFALEDAWFRDAGRELAQFRDEAAILETLDKLDVSNPIKATARRWIEQSRPPQDHRPLDRVVAGLVEQLVFPTVRIAGWPPIDDSFDAIADGLARAYRGGRRGMHARSAEEMHEWRKRVKEHWYHVLLLRQMWPPMMKAYAGVLENLSHALGDHHDFHVLRGRVGMRQTRLHAAIDAKQTALGKVALDIGRRVYAEPSRRFVARMREYWRAWRT
jgi:CHAD domain-containing protein